ncbi:MAG TPA: hypothetical protein VGF75_05990 [Candidatus Saccharimonadales bacterium]
MADKIRLPGSEFVSKDRVELMIKQALEPINTKLGNLEKHAYSFYGNGSGNKGKLEIMEDVQTDRWNEQKEWRKEVNEKLSKLGNILVSGTAVAKDRRWLVATGITALAVIGDLMIKFWGK